MAGPFTYPVAQSIPFEANRPADRAFGGVPSELQSENVQDAIEEAKVDAINNDRFITLCSYGGNALNCRYLEFFPGIASDEAQIFLAAASRILTITARTTANSTCTIGFFDLNISSTVPVYTVTFSATQQVVALGTPVAPLAVTQPNCRLAVRVTSGTAAKPHIMFTLSAAT